MLPPIVLLAACATAPPPEPPGGPRGLYASDHAALAREHDRLATRRPVWPDAMSSQPGRPEAGVWYGSWDVTEHERLAETHRTQAIELEKQYQDLCAGFAAAEVSVSPLRRHGVGGWNTASGVIMYLSPSAGPPERLLAQLRCHRAWMMLAPADMDDCPLDLPGLVLDARGDVDGVTVSLTVRDRGLVRELQRRATVELESSMPKAAAAAVP
jgi:hypothetical protein